MQENCTETVMWSIREKNSLEVVLLISKINIFESEMQMIFTWRSNFFDKLVLCFKHENWKGLMISIDEKDCRTRTAFLTYIKLYYIAFIHIHLIYWWQTKYINCTVIYKANTMCWNLTQIVDWRVDQWRSDLDSTLDLDQAQNQQSLTQFYM